MNYFEKDCSIYLHAIASWSFEADTSGECYATIAICENPDDTPFYLLDECQGGPDTIPIVKGTNDLTFEYIINVLSNVPYTAGMWQRYKLDDGQNILIIDNGMGVSGNIEAYEGNIPGIVYDTIKTILIDTITIYDTIKLEVCDTSLIETIYITQDLTTGTNIAPEGAMNIVVKLYEITANFMFDEAAIYDMNGKLMLQVSSTSSISIAELNAGIYILKATVNNQPIELKFIKYLVL